MNRADAEQIMRIMSAPYGFPIEPDTLEAWYLGALERCDPTIATDVAVRLVETQERFPTPAVFNNTRQAIERERYKAKLDAAAAEERRALAASMPDTDDAKAQHARFIQMLRDTLARASKAQHNHKGGRDNPCPVCGGFDDRVPVR